MKLRIYSFFLCKLGGKCKLRVPKLSVFSQLPMVFGLDQECICLIIQPQKFFQICFCKGHCNLNFVPTEIVIGFSPSTWAPSTWPAPPVLVPGAQNSNRGLFLCSICPHFIDFADVVVVRVLRRNHQICKIAAPMHSHSM